MGSDPKNGKAVHHNDEKITAFSNGKIISYNEIGKQAIAVKVSEQESEPLQPVREERYLFCLRHKKLSVIVFLILVLIIAGTVGGGVGGTRHTRVENSGVIRPVPTSPPTGGSKTQYANTGLAAIQWTDLNGTLHKSVYYQDKDNKIRESAWNNGTTFNAAWQINVIGNAVKPGTPIAAAAGYPHASHNYSLVYHT